jgi:PqqD family protein of HPr-rel-A system
MTVSVGHGKPMRRPGVWLRQAGEENAVYDPLSETLHLLNDTALAIWQLCDGETSPEEMVRAICELFGTPEDVVRKDVNRILLEFEAAGIVYWEKAVAGDQA